MSSVALLYPCVNPMNYSGIKRVFTAHFPINNCRLLDALSDKDELFFIEIIIAAAHDVVNHSVFLPA